MKKKNSLIELLKDTSVLFFMMTVTHVVILSFNAWFHGTPQTLIRPSDILLEAVIVVIISVYRYITDRDMFISLE